jgi:hypothetical protein
MIVNANDLAYIIILIFWQMLQKREINRYGCCVTFHRLRLALSLTPIEPKWHRLRLKARWTFYSVNYAKTDRVECQVHSTRVEPKCSSACVVLLSDIVVLLLLHQTL